MIGNERAGGVQGDDLAALQHCHPVTQPLCFLHKVGDQDHARPAVTDGAHQIPRGMAGSRVKAGRHLIQEDQLRTVDQRKRDEQALALPPGQVGKVGVPLLRQTPLLDELLWVTRAGDERGKPPQRLPDLDPLRERRFLQLAPDPLAQLAGLGQRVKAKHPHPAAVSPPQALQALDGRRLPRAITSQDAEDLPPPDLEGDTLDHHRTAITLRQALDHDHRFHDAAPTAASTGPR
jgi:hypothetical protein